MNRLKGKCLLVLGLSLLWVSPVLAISLGFVPSTQTVGLGAFDVDVVISDLSGEIVSAFDLDVTYDATNLNATGVTFGPLLGDPFLFEAVEDFDLSISGVVDFAELSLLFDFELDAIQPDTFTLATLTFDAIAVGTSSLDFIWNGSNYIIGRNGLVLNISSTPGSVSAVPEPATILLVGSGLIGFAGFGRKKFLRK
jgi:hypothetical protein